MLQEIIGYRTERWRQALCILGYILSLGFLLLLFHWKPEWDVWCQCVPCDLKEASVILLRTTDEFQKCFKKNIHSIQPFNVGDNNESRMIADEKSLFKKALIMPEKKIRCLRAQKIQYVWNTVEKKFQKIGILEEEYSCSEIHTNFGSGFTKEEQNIRRKVCGPNTIEVEVAPIWKLLFKEVLNPFYVFQAFSISLWYAILYIEYTSVLVFITLLSICVTIYSLRKESVKLHKLVESHNNMMVKILRKNGVIEEVESRCLVPGDVIVVTGSKYYIPCDAILVTGGCIVNEGMLTGESIPVTKTSLPNVKNPIPWKMYSGEDYKRHVLFCGTEVIQAKSTNNGLVKAVVLRTGFNTTKGDLVRSIMYPKPVNFKLYRDAIRFLIVLSVISVGALIYVAVISTRQGVPVPNTVVWSLLIVTVCISPALPASLTIGIMYSQKRLQKIGIYCLSAQRINMCGRLNIICFDKTGTLTQDGMELWGIVPSVKKCFQDVHCFTPGSSLVWGPLLASMVSCHSLVLLDGKTHGDPLDMKMFEETGWELHDKEANTSEGEEAASYMIVKPGPRASKVPVEGLTILHQFPFSSSLQRMSVIVQIIGGDEFLVFLKGAPEMVVQFCTPDSVPSKFQKELEFFAMQGFRVIALAYKTLLTQNYLDIKSLEREDVESDLIFLGLLIMENKLKPETKPVLQELQAANIRTVMITGDNLQTACTIGKSSGMVPGDCKLILIDAKGPDGDSPASICWQIMEEKSLKEDVENDVKIDICEKKDVHNKDNNFHFVMIGKSFEVLVKHFYNLLQKILLNATIFARMSPGQKSKLIEEIQKIDYFAGMCGDGANDCGALKTAYAGIALTELEASVASPFTSKTPNIECVPKLIKEGRNTLVSSFCMFKCIAMYSMIGMICLLLLLSKQVYIYNRLYLLEDVSIIIVSVLTLTLSGPAPKLTPYRPAAQLISPPLLLSLILQFIFTLSVQIIGFTLTQKQPWYNESDVLSGCQPVNHSTFNDTAKETPLPYQHFLSTTMWFITGINLIITEFVNAKGMPFRKPIYTNYLFFGFMILQLATYLFMYFANIQNLYRIMQMVCTPYYWRGNVLIMVTVQLGVTYIVEEGFIENRKLWLVIKRIFKYQSKSQYRKLQRIVEQDRNWPPQNQTDYADKMGTEKEVTESHVYDNSTFDPLSENING